MATTTMDVTNQTTTAVHKPHRHTPHIATLPNEAISSLTGYNGLTLTVVLCILFLIRHYALEGYLFKRVYGSTWTRMNDTTKRGFVNHHIGGAIKIVILVVGAYPWVHVLFGSANLHTPLGRRAHPTMGDLLVILVQVFCSMYIFELLYRGKLSPIAVAHHIGAIVIAQTAVVLSLDLVHQRDATLEFVMCLVWGAFDVLAEFWPNLAIILYRVQNDNHAFLANVFLATSIITLLGTTAETIMIMVLFGMSWDNWELSFKIVTPILHIIFTLAQLHGSRILFTMYLSQKRKVAEEDQALDPEQASSKKENVEESDGVKRRPSAVATEIHTTGEGRSILPSPGVNRPPRETTLPTWLNPFARKS